MRRFLAILLCAAMLAVPVRAAEETKYAVLTFDDGPSGRFTRRLLDCLKERDVKSTFLLCGYRIKDYSNEAQRIFDEGHEIGIHGYSHKSMCSMSQEEVAREIQDTAALLPAGCSPVFMRPPGGMCSDAVYEAVRAAGLAVLTWSVDPKDWATRDTSAIVNMVVSNTQDGDVILLHDMSDSSVTAALQIIDQLQAKGFRFVTASQLAQIKGTQCQAGEVYCDFD